MTYFRVVFYQDFDMMYRKVYTYYKDAFEQFIKFASSIQDDNCSYSLELIEFELAEDVTAIDLLNNANYMINPIVHGYINSEGFIYEDINS